MDDEFLGNFPLRKQNNENTLLESCGSYHPDDASMVIIRDVWRKLQEDQESEDIRTE